MKSQLLIAALCISFLSGCSKDDDKPNSNAERIVDKSWRTVEYKFNGTADPFVVGQQPTFNFRSDGKMYFSQINPSFKDTLQFTFLDETNIRLTKPQVSPTDYINLKIDLIGDTNFDFTMTNNQNSDIDTYKTVKQ